MSSNFEFPHSNDVIKRAANLGYHNITEHPQPLLEDAYQHGLIQHPDLQSRPLCPQAMFRLLATAVKLFEEYHKK